MWLPAIPKVSFYVFGICRHLLSSEKFKESSRNDSSHHFSCCRVSVLWGCRSSEAITSIKCLIRWLLCLSSFHFCNPTLVTVLIFFKNWGADIEGSWRSLQTLVQVELLLILTQPSTSLFDSLVCWLQPGSPWKTESCLQLPCWSWPQICRKNERQGKRWFRCLRDDHQTQHNMEIKDDL